MICEPIIFSMFEQKQRVTLVFSLSNWFNRIHPFCGHLAGIASRDIVALGNLASSVDIGDTLGAWAG